MENDGSSRPSDAASLSRTNDGFFARQLRTHEFRILTLEAELAVLRLQNTHHAEDNAAVCAQRDEYKAERDRYKSERDEVRRKYEGLKKSWTGLRQRYRKYEPGSDGGEQRDAPLHGEKSPVEESCSPVTRRCASKFLNTNLPSNSNLGESIVRKASECRNLLQTSPGVPAISPLERTNDPRKRLKIDPTSSPDLPRSPPSLPSNASPPSIPAVTSTNSISNSPSSLSDARLSSSSSSLSSSTSSSSLHLHHQDMDMDMDLQTNAHPRDSDRNAITKRFPVSLPTPTAPHPSPNPNPRHNPNTSMNTTCLPPRPRPMIFHQNQCRSRVRDTLAMAAGGAGRRNSRRRCNSYNSNRSPSLHARAG
ncbi:hypothetical protein B0H12DRAFT_1148652 [Mycena haematopus]|nr:hypothetical protein B0H12DRAFT_1148652 [Mycena haematopus]